MKVFILTCLFTAVGWTLSLSQSQVSSHQKNISFVENKGQWKTSELFRSDMANARLTLFKDKLRFGFLDEGDMDRVKQKKHLHGNPKAKPLNDEVIRGHVHDVSFLNSNPNVVLQGSEKLATYNNYFIGKDPSQWAGHVALFGEVTYSELWSHIDLKIHNTDGRYKYDLVIHPNGNASEIEMLYAGVKSIQIKNNQLVVTTSINKVIEFIPEAYQIIEGIKEKVICNYVLKGDTVSFVFPEGYQTKYPLVIDPELVFSTYSGSTADNWGFTATPGPNQNLYGGGIVFFIGYPTTPGAFQTTFGNGQTDIGITKYTADGSAQLYATYFGGDQLDVPHSMIADSQDNLIVFGTTSSENFPVSEDAYDDTFNGGSFEDYNELFYNNGSDMFVFKLSSDGSQLIGSTYIGGSGNDGVNISNDLVVNYGDQARGEVMIDETNKIYIASVSESSDFPNSPGSIQSNLLGNQDGVLFKLASNLTGMEWSTYLGGSGDDACYSVKKNDDNLFVCGGTNSNNMMTTTGAFDESYNGNVDGFIASITTSGALNSLTYVGTSSYDQTYFVEYDLEGNVYTLGQTKGDYPVSPDVWAVEGSAQFIHKFTDDLSTGLLSTTFGDGTNDDVNISPTAFLLDRCNDIFISGWGGGTNFPEGSTFNLPITSDALQPTTDGSDFYFLQLQSDFQDILYATYYGGAATQEHVDGGTSRFDKKGVIYQAVCAGCGGSDNFPTTSGAWSQTNNSFNCNLGSIKMILDPRQIIAFPDAEPNAIGCAPFTVDFVSFTAAEDYIWDFGDGSPQSNLQNPTYTYSDIGNYVVTHIVIDSTTCNISDTTTLNITIYESPVIVESDLEVDCNTVSVSFSNTFTSGEDRIVYSWDVGDGTFYELNSVTHIYDEPGEYEITFSFTDTVCNIDSTYTQLITIPPNIVADFQLVDENQEPLNETIVCLPLDLYVSNTSDAVSYLWNFGDSEDTVDGFEPTYTYTNLGNYIVSLIAIDSTSCNIRDTMFMDVGVENQILLSAGFDLENVCTDSTVTLTNLGTSGLPEGSYYWDFGDGTDSSIENVIHLYGEPGTYQITQIISDTSIFCAVPDTVIQTVDVAFPSFLVADFEYEANCADSAVQFYATGSVDSPGATLFWDFGNQITSTDTTPWVVFPEAGFYEIVLIITDDNECTVADTLMQSIEVNYLLDINPLYELIIDCEDTTVTFINTGETDANIGVTWLLDDEFIYENQNIVQHQFAEPGWHAFKMVVSDLFCLQSDSVFGDVFIKPNIVAQFLPSDTGGCSPIDFSFLNFSLNGGTQTTYQWNFGEGSVATTNNAEFTYDVTEEQPLIVELIMEDPTSCNLSDTSSIPILISPVIELNFEPLYELCEGDVLTLGSGFPDESTVWSTGQTDETINITQNGIYKLWVNNTFCGDSAEFEALFFPHPSTYSEAIICPEPPYALNTLPGSSSIRWSTGAITPTIYVDKPDLYYNNYLDSNLCTRSDTVRIELRDDSDRFFAPNSFTPNQDGTNDTWKIVSGDENTFKLQIFDRWGNQIWQGNDQNSEWDGTSEGKESPQGVYVYKVSFYSSCYNKTIESSGSITLIR